jgi:RNase P subunit RPR2
MTLFVVSGYFNGICEKCKEPSVGQFDSDDDRDEEGNHWVNMKCINCSHKQWFNVVPELEYVAPAPPSRDTLSEEKE